MPDVREGQMRRVTGNTEKHKSAVVLPTNVISGITPKTQLKLADTDYYQVGPHGDYVQG